ncbi:hypothetical protein SAMN02745126_04125 [Enhydrobacter aerosaccus]|uniref:Uncharacterized protein n=1 Tax=Enhydrobacter aerosaccus TaxID=225324 RepID=A0A1T4RX87_9HYPH|nr:hypothetical protein [Enhydrobacter aerosaccus]SKA20573.1 hypothetical protein SAMN02745126_04125 [Enhydrobacter aerosaccus]
MTARRLLPWAIALFFALVVGFGIAISLGWLEEPALTRSDYVGTTDVTADDARLYRTVPFEWRVTGAAGAFTGSDIAHIRVDPSGERTLICGWLSRDKAGASMRASRWLSEARLRVGDIVISAGFIAPTDSSPGNDLHAGCAGLYDGLRPAGDAALALEGPSVHE